MTSKISQRGCRAQEGASICVRKPLNDRARAPMRNPMTLKSHIEPGVARERFTLTSTVRLLWPYIWPANRTDLKVRIGLAFALMLLSKLITVVIPYSFKWVTDSLAGKLQAGAIPLRADYDWRRIFNCPLRRAAHFDGVNAAGARRALCGRGDERGAKTCDRGVRAPAPLVAAFSSGAQDRRPDPRPRARTQRHRDDHPHLDADRSADSRRVRADRRRVADLLRLALRCGDRRHGCGLS